MATSGGSAGVGCDRSPPGDRREGPRSGWPLPSRPRVGRAQGSARAGIPRGGRSALTQTIRPFLLVEAASFVAAVLVHFGVLASGYEHRAAGTPEGVIGVVLLLGVVGALTRPPWARAAGLAGQAFALLGTLVGVFTIAVGVGPRTAPDLAYHAGIRLGLVWGLVAAGRAVVQVDAGTCACVAPDGGAKRRRPRVASNCAAASHDTPRRSGKGRSCDPAWTSGACCERRRRR